VDREVSLKLLPREKEKSGFLPGGKKRATRPALEKRRRARTERRGKKGETVQPVTS